ncbi:hypothetical protein BGZ83_001336 [Gryganskiella cystojenkinii]|nr:hypothetical protein BGZ83_001336 [Gryganskiella cystojenkinii]
MRSTGRYIKDTLTASSATQNEEQENMSRLSRLPPEIIYCILRHLSPRHMIPLTQVSLRLRRLTLWQLKTIFDMRLGTPSFLERENKCAQQQEHDDQQLESDRQECCDVDPPRKRTYERHAQRLLRSRPGNSDIHWDKPKSRSQEAMSDFELYTRMLLAEFYESEHSSPAYTDGKETVGRVLITAKAILRRLYLSDSINDRYLDEVEGLRRYQLEHEDDDDQALKDPTIDDCIEHVDALGFRYSVLSNTTSTPLPPLGITITDAIIETTTTTTRPPPTPLLNPYVISKINMHVVARVIADQVCRGLCLPESAVLILQCLTSLRDQDHFHYLVNVPERNASLRVPVHEDRTSIGQLCFQYLVPSVMTLLKPCPSNSLSSSSSQSKAKSTHALRLGEPTTLTADLFLPGSSSKYHRPKVDHTKSLTSQVLLEQQELMQPFPSPSCPLSTVVHESRILCFLPLLGRHFNTLPTSTFIEMFLDQSKGDLPIDRAAVMVYGFMCVLDLETGKANLASDSYRIFERSMPTQGRVQAAEMIRIVERHRLLMRGFLLSSPTFSSSRVFRQNLSSQGVH